MHHRDSAKPPATRRFFRFRLRSLLLVMLLVAVYLGGRESKFGWNAPQAGTWRLVLPAGFERGATLIRRADGTFSLNTSGNLSGTYIWKSSQLVMQEPADKRMMGMTWEWQGEKLMLIAEPLPPPAGARYTGAILEFVTPDTSPAARRAVPKIKPAPKSIQKSKTGKPRVI